MTTRERKKKELSPQTYVVRRRLETELLSNYLHGHYVGILSLLAIPTSFVCTDIAAHYYYTYNKNKKILRNRGARSSSARFGWENISGRVTSSRSAYEEVVNTITNNYYFFVILRSFFFNTYLPTYTYLVTISFFCLLK